VCQPVGGDLVEQIADNGANAGCFVRGQLPRLALRREELLKLRAADFAVMNLDLDAAVAPAAEQEQQIEKKRAGGRHRYGGLRDRMRPARKSLEEVRIEQNPDGAEHGQPDEKRAA